MARNFARALLVTVCLLHGNPASAEPFVIDQQFLPSSLLAPGVFEATVQPLALGPTYGQTFTVDRSGRLVGADLLLDGVIPGRALNDVLITVVSTSGGFPTDTVLGRGTIPRASVPTGFPSLPLTHVSFGPGTQVMAGQHLALLFSSAGPLSGSPNIAGESGLGALYPRGDAVAFAFGAWRPAIEIFQPGAAGSADFFFRTSVEPVPEPGTILLLGAGLLGLAGRCYHRHGRR
jgi:hypothetical protein